MGSMDDGFSRWWHALADIINLSHTATADELPPMLSQAAGRVGIAAEMYLVDLAQRMLTPVRPKAAEVLHVDGTIAGRAYQLVEIVASIEPHGEPVLWVPLLDGTERLGVVRLDLPAGADPQDAELRQRCWVLCGLLGHIVQTKFGYGDTLHAVQRSRPLSVDAELLWRLLPPLTFATDQLTITAVLEPYDRLGGDSFDYAVDDAVAHFAVFDAVGHDLQAGLTSAVALAATRNARRHGDHDLTSLARRADELLIKEGPGWRFVTAVLARLDIRTGELSYLIAGHPPPLLLRSNKTVKTLQHGPRVPLGVTGPDVGIGYEQLEPGDRLLLYTDGVVEARDHSGKAFGTDRLIDLAERNAVNDLPAPESLRRLSHALLEYQGERLQDDATLLMLDWHQRPARQTPYRTAQGEADGA